MDPRSSRAVQIGGLLGFSAVVAAVALIGALGSASAGDEYTALDRPAWAPPGWLFSPVWTVLYVTIAASPMYFSTTPPCWPTTRRTVA